MATIITNRTLSFIALADGVIHTFEEKPRSQKPTGFIPAGTVIDITTKEKVPESMGKWPNTNKGTVEVAGELVTVYVHDNHILSKEQQKEQRLAAPAAQAKKESPEQKLHRLAEEMKRAQAEVEAAKRARLADAVALIKELGGEVELPELQDAGQDVDLEQELAAANA